MATKRPDAVRVLTPDWQHAEGSPEVGESGDVVVTLTFHHPDAADCVRLVIDPAALALLVADVKSEDHARAVERSCADCRREEVARG